MVKHSMVHLEKDMIDLLKELVYLESPSDDRASVVTLLRYLDDYCRNIGAKTEWLMREDESESLKAQWGDGTNKILILAHVDTVWPLGEIEKRPFTIEDNLIYGPGILDMKGGIVQALFAVNQFVAQKGLSSSEQITFLFTPDEEIGSSMSRHWIEQEAQDSCAVLVLEPCGPGGKLKIARKGWALYKLHVEGRAAHAGNDPEKGISAIVELAKQALHIKKLEGYSTGISVNIGTFNGGSRPNVVADYACAEIDVRVQTEEEAEMAIDFFKKLRPDHPEAVLRLEGGLNRPAMELTENNQKLFHLAQQVGEEVGMTVEGMQVGGVSDGNFTSALNIPTLDGLGAAGSGIHALNEHLIKDELGPRSAFLALLIEKVLNSKK